MSFIKRVLSLIGIVISITGFNGCGSDDAPSTAGTDYSVYKPTRVENSPYPVSAKPDNLFIIKAENLSHTQLITVQSLQGILAQTKPRIYILPQGNSLYSQWLSDLQKNYGITPDYTYSNNFSGLINHFKSEIQGYVLANYSESSIHPAITLSGIKKAIVIFSSDEQAAKDAGLQLVENATNLSFNDFLNKCSAEANKNLFCFQSLEKSNYLTDYATFGRAFHFYESSFGTETAQITSLLSPNTPLLGWGSDEYKLVENASKNSVYVNPADYALNLSVLSNVGVQTKQPKTKSESEVEVIENVHTVCFVMTDGDNIQWLLNDFYTSGGLYGSSNRKKANIGWTISPALSELAPSIMKKIYDNAGTADGKRDYFIAGPSGVGYMFPELYGNLSSFSNLTSSFMKKADLRILNILGNSINENYLQPYLLQDQIDAIFFYYYYDYSGGKGNITWVNDKPVITGRYNLWGSNEYPLSLAQKINTLSTDIHSSRGYSLIPVHVWTRGVADVLDAIALFNKDVRVVAPDEFVALIKKNIAH